MSLLIKYPVTSAVALVLVTLLAFVGGYLRRDLVCPNHVSLFPFCYWSVAIGFTVPCAAAVSAAVLGLVTRFVSYGFDLVRSYLVPIARKVRNLVRGYPWYCLFVALVLFGPWDWRLGWVISSLLARLGSLLELVVASARYLLYLLAPPVLSVWSRIQIKATACERIRAKAIGSHMALGLKILVWIPSLTSRTGFEWLYELWRTTNPRKLRSSSVTIGQCATPAVVDYAELQANLIQEATIIATQRCNEIPSARLQQLGGWAVAHPWTVNFELQRLEREHPESKGLEQWKQEKERQAAVWDAIRAERKTGQVIPGAFDINNPRPDPLETPQDRKADIGDLSIEGAVGDVVSMVLRPVLILPSLLRFPSWLPLPSCAGRPAPATVPASTIYQSTPRTSVAGNAPQGSRSNQPRRRTGFGVSSSRSTTFNRSAISLPTPRPQPASRRAVSIQTATRTPTADTPLRAGLRSPSYYSNSSSGSNGVPSAVGLDRALQHYKSHTEPTADVQSEVLAEHMLTTSSELIEERGIATIVRAPALEIPFDAAATSMDTETDFASACLAAQVLVSAIVPQFSRMSIVEDPDVEMAFDAVDTPDVTMSTPELEDIDMFDPPTPPSPMLVDLPEVQEVFMESPPLPSQPDTMMGCTVGTCEPTVPVYIQPGAWDGFMVWHQELVRAAVVPAYFVPPIPQAWSQPTLAPNSDLGSTWQGAGHVWNEGYPESTYTNVWVPEFGPDAGNSAGLVENTAWSGAMVEPPTMAAEDYERQVSIDRLTPSFTDIYVPEYQVIEPTNDAPSSEWTWTYATSEPAPYGTVQHVEYAHQDRVDVAELAQAFESMCAPGLETSTSQAAVEDPIATAESAAHEWTEIIEHAASRENGYQDKSAVASLAQALAGMCVPGCESVQVAVSETVEATSEDLCRPETEPMPVPASSVEPESAGQVAMDDLVNSLKCMRTSGVDYTQSQVSKATRVAVITEVSGSSGPDFVGLEADEDESEDEDELAEVERQLEADADAETETDDEEAEANLEEGLGIEDPDAAAEAFLARMQAQGLLGPAVPGSSLQG